MRFGLGQCHVGCARLWIDLGRLCAAETRCGCRRERMGATRLDLRDRGAEDRSVIDLLRNVVAAALRFFAPRAVVAAENLLLRHQLIVLRRSRPRPRLGRLDRCLIATLATRTRSLLESLIVVRPATVLRWHRAGWRLWWLAFEPSGRPAADRHRVEGPHPADVARKPPVGREPDCRRVCEARVARLAAHGRQVPPEALGAWPRSVLEDLSPEPRLADLGLRLLHGGHRPFPDPLRIRSHLPPAPRAPPRRFHRTPHR